MAYPKRGERYVNNMGEYCIIQSIYGNIVKLRICGENARLETWELKDLMKLLKGRMFKVPFPKIDRTNVANHLLNYQFNIIGKTMADTKENKNWFKEWTITEVEFKIFKRYALHVLKKVFKFNSKKAKETFNWWNDHFGLKIVEDKRI